MRELREGRYQLNPGSTNLSLLDEAGVPRTEDALAQTLRHELQHGKQSMQQVGNLLDNKSVLSSGALYDSGGEWAGNLKGSKPSGLGNRETRYSLNPQEIDARAAELGEVPTRVANRHSLASAYGFGDDAISNPTAHADAIFSTNPGEAISASAVHQNGQ